MNYGVKVLGYPNHYNEVNLNLTVGRFSHTHKKKMTMIHLAYRFYKILYVRLHEAYKFWFLI
jgi:hypothetical protein